MTPAPPTFNLFVQCFCFVGLLSCLSYMLGFVTRDLVFKVFRDVEFFLYFFIQDHANCFGNVIQFFFFFFLYYFIVLHISNCTHLVSRKQLSLYLLVDAWILRLPPQLVLGNSIMCQTSLCPLDLCHSNGQVSCWWHRECCSCGSEP